MLDCDGEVRPWNDRWSSGVHEINDLLHPSHRVRFATPSVFEMAESQTWRRQQHFEVARGDWKSIHTKRPHRFPPLGV